MAELATQNIVSEDLQETTQFAVDHVSKVIKQCIEKAIGNNNYDLDKVNQWTSQISETCLDELTKDQKPYKYVVTALILQKNGGGLHTSTSSFWNQETDGSCTVRWENPTMYCMVSVFGCAV